MELPKGVYVSGVKFVARLRFESKLMHLGTFTTVEEANTALQEKRKELGVVGNNTKLRIIKDKDE
jgi:hypothetical protein